MAPLDDTAARGLGWKAGPSDLIWRSWDRDEFVVYHVASGDTHLINEVTARVLETLQASPLSFEELTRRVAHALQVEVDESFEASLAKLLVYLDEIGLAGAVR